MSKYSPFREHLQRARVAAVRLDFADAERVPREKLVRASMTVLDPE